MSFLILLIAASTNMNIQQWFMEEELSNSLSLNQCSQDINQDFFFLEIHPASNTEQSSCVIAPPPGIYPFKKGDRVVLHAYWKGEAPLVPSWSGDVSSIGHTVPIVVDRNKSISVQFVPSKNKTEESVLWIEALEDTNTYAFLGGGNLYGWFSAARDKNKGAGLMGLTHKTRLCSPMMPLLTLNFEHIFSDSPEDCFRNEYTPRTDPLQFRITSPDTVHMRSHANKSTWKTDWDMKYQFSGNDSIDLAFSIALKEQTSSPKNYVFMWASYQNQSEDRAIYFPGSKSGTFGWQRFGPSEKTSLLNGGTIGYQNVASIGMKNDACNVNLLPEENLYFTVPVYFGLLNCASKGTYNAQQMACIMMFNQDAPIRFSLWNWGNPQSISAWDWQYILRNSALHAEGGYEARLLLTPFAGHESILKHYQSWKQELVSPPISETQSWPTSPFYWSPAITYFDPIRLGKLLFEQNPRYALTVCRTLNYAGILFKY